jgi:hypothetical protein
MPNDKPEGYKKQLGYLKDIAYVIGLVIALTGWITTKSKSNAILETTVKYNTKTIEKFEPFIERQGELNGKFLQHLADYDDH